MNPQTISIPTTHNQTIDCWIMQPETSNSTRPVVIAIHGWKSSSKKFFARLEPLVALGYIGVTFELRGHGDSPYQLADFTRASHLDDCLAVYDFVSSLTEVHTSQISVMGFSYGGYLAARLCQQRKIQNLVLMAPALYSTQTEAVPQALQLSQEKQYYRSQHHTFRDDLALAAVHQFTGKALLIQPELDTQISQQVFLDYQEAFGFNHEHILVPKADHSLHNPGANEVVMGIITQWFKNHLGM